MLGKIVVLAASIISGFGAVGAFAEHDIGPIHSGEVQSLRMETRRLVRMIETYNLGYDVEQGALNFEADVDGLVHCRRLRIDGDGPIIVDPDDLDFLGGVGIGQCAHQKDRVRRSFTLLERHLRRFLVSEPRLHRQLESTRMALNRVLNGGGVVEPVFEEYRCVAVDSGWEEHGGGHVGIGRNVSMAQRVALRECERHHGVCRIRNCDRLQ